MAGKDALLADFWNSGEGTGMEIRMKKYYEHVDPL